jgi:Flp pilus assembly protein TadG
MKTSAMLRRNDPRQQRGAVAVLVALMLPVLIASAAFAIDLAYVHVVRSEMQNDADAAALAGAHALVDAGTGSLRWNEAATQAQQSVALNSAAGQVLQDAQVQTGYWNLKGEPTGLQALPMTPNVWDVPAVAVTIRKQEGQNQGPVRTFFARFWQVLGINQQVTAVAAPTSPGMILPGGLFPLAMAQCMYDTYWDRSVYPPRPRIDPGTGKPYVFKIGSSYHYSTCSSGEWTSLLSDANDVGTIRQLIAQGNPVSLEMGQNIWIEPGSKATLYQSVQKCSAAGDRSCEYVVVPTVTQTDNHALSPVTGFACLHILDANNGQKYVLAEMSNRCNTSLAGGVGPNYGVLTPPGLVH